MCGRYASSRKPEDLAEEFEIDRARAAGIPTKIYVGLVNLEGYAYYYHAWCAVWLGTWVPVDPTFNQFPADVGHLKLKEGGIAEQAVVLKVVGKLKIKTKEYTE